MTDQRKKRRHTVRNQQLLSVIVLLPLFCIFFYFSTKKKLSSLSHSEKIGFAFAKFTSTSRLFFLLLFTLYKKWLLLNLVCLQSRPHFYPRLLVFPQLIVLPTFTRLFLFFLRFFKLVFFVFIPLCRCCFRKLLRECMCVCKCVCECYLSH